MTKAKRASSEFAHLHSGTTDHSRSAQRADEPEAQRKR